MPGTIPAQLLAAIKGRRFPSIARMFATGVDFQAWTPAGHWTANDGATIAKIVEVWFSPVGAPSNITFSNETVGARGAAMLEYEIEWKVQPDDQPRVLRQIHLLTIKNDKIIAARVYCAGLHTEFPEVDLEKQRRSKGLGVPPKPLTAARAPAIKVSTSATT